MKLIFTTLSLIVAGMVLLAGISVFGLSMSDITKQRQEAAKILVTGIAYNVGAQMQLLEKLVNQVATDDEVIQVMQSANPDLIAQKAQQMQKFLPHIMKLRLLPPTVDNVDESITPFMGYADLEMVKNTLSAPQPAIIQGEGNNRHLAMTALIKTDQQILGIVLASFQFDFLQDILANSAIGEHFIELSQSSVILMTAGNNRLQTDPKQQIQLAHSPWQLNYVVASAFEFSNISLIFIIVGSLAGIASLCLLGSYFYTSNLLKKDENKVLEAVKDLMTGKELGQYPVQLNEMQPILSTIAQFKRILDNKQAKSQHNTEPDELKLTDHYLVDDSSLLDELTGTKSPIVKPSKKKN